MTPNERRALAVIIAVQHPSYEDAAQAMERVAETAEAKFPGMPHGAKRNLTRDTVMLARSLASDLRGLA